MWAETGTKQLQENLGRGWLGGNHPILHLQICRVWQIWHYKCLGIFSGLTLYKIYSVRTNFSLYTKNLLYLYSEYLLPSELVTSQIKDSGCKCWAPFFPFPETLLSNRFTLVLTWKFTFTICLHWSKGWLGATVITHILKKMESKIFCHDSEVKTRTCCKS